MPHDDEASEWTILMILRFACGLNKEMSATTARDDGARTTLPIPSFPPCRAFLPWRTASSAYDFTAKEPYKVFEKSCPQCAPSVARLAQPTNSISGRRGGEGWKLGGQKRLALTPTPCCFVCHSRPAGASEQRSWEQIIRGASYKWGWAFVWLRPQLEAGGAKR